MSEQILLKVALIPQVPPIQHERIDVAPNLGKLRNVADPAIEIWRARNRDIRADFRATDLRHGRKRLDRSRDRLRGFDMRVRPHRRLALVWIGEQVHQPQAGHRVLGVADGASVARRDLVARIVFRERGATH